MTDQKIITDLPLIRRYSRHNESQDQRFRAYLKTVNTSNADLDARVNNATEEIWRQIDCTTCGACCKTLEVVVDDSDIKRLARKFSVSVKEFEKAYTVRGEDRTKLLKSRPCVFLGKDNRCKIYEDRPRACRDFPYLHEKDFRNRSLMMLNNLELCPIVFNVWQRLKEELWPGSTAKRGRPPRPNK